MKPLAFIAIFAVSAASAYGGMRYERRHAPTIPQLVEMVNSAVTFGWLCHARSGSDQPTSTLDECKAAAMAVLQVTP